MLQKITSSRHHNKMMRFIKPLENHFGVNHFWYYRVTYSGHYSFVGTNSAWDEYCFSRNLFKICPYLRHPDLLQAGLTLMKNGNDPAYQSLLQDAKDKFDVNFSIQLSKHIPEGIEGYGFGTFHKRKIPDEHLINELPLLCQFAKRFRQENASIFHLLDDNRVHIESHIGETFTSAPNAVEAPQREDFLRQLGFQAVLSLTAKELAIFKDLAYGFPAHYLASKHFLSQRTIEHYMERLKNKLNCHSKLDLINKSKEFIAFEQSHINF